jgi:hypothetical protein
MPRLDQLLGHGLAHAPQSDPAYALIHACLAVVLNETVVCRSTTLRTMRALEISFPTA